MWVSDVKIDQKTIKAYFRLFYTLFVMTQFTPKRDVYEENELEKIKFIQKFPKILDFFKPSFSQNGEV